MKSIIAPAMRAFAFCCGFLLIPLQAIAQEEVLIAGWDFSQYSNLGFLSLDGATLVNTLDANHSDLDPTERSGIESNEFGTMHLDGLFGSTSTPLSLEPGVDPFVPNAVPPDNDLLSNASQAFLGFGSGAACTRGQVEQMPAANCNTVAMTAISSVSVVFEADRSTAPSATGTWYVSFAGRMVNPTDPTTSSVSVAFSDDGVSYSVVGNATLDAVDTLYRFPLGGSSAQQAFVRLTFPAQASTAQAAAIDNLGISVPEPAGAGVAGVIGLAALFRARRRS